MGPPDLEVVGRSPEPDRRDRGPDGGGDERDGRCGGGGAGDCRKRRGALGLDRTGGGVGPRAVGDGPGAVRASRQVQGRVGTRSASFRAEWHDLVAAGWLAFADIPPMGGGALRAGDSLTLLPAAPAPA